MTNKCQHCSKEFEAKRVSSLYCSPKCRKLAFLGKEKVSVPGVSVPHLAGNPDNPVVDYYKGLPITQEGAEMLKNPSILFDQYTAVEIAALGIKPPKWKRYYKTRQEAITALREMLEEKYGTQFGTEVKEDYSTWK